VGDDIEEDLFDEQALSPEAVDDDFPVHEEIGDQSN
jgi:hypothetical protein